MKVIALSIHRRQVGAENVGARGVCAAEPWPGQVAVLLLDIAKRLAPLLDAEEATWLAQATRALNASSVELARLLRRGKAVTYSRTSSWILESFR